MRFCLVCLGLALCLEARAVPGDVLRFALPGWVELELVEVGGRSKLPLQYLYSRENKDSLIDVSAPRYWIGRYEVSQKQYTAVMGIRPSEAKDERLPVTNIRWRDAVEFCDRLNEVALGEIPSGYRFDLPTMIEWAHAYVGGTSGDFRYSGSDDIDAVAWHGIERDAGTVEFDALHLPGLKLPNAVNAYDMSGNVAEYVFVADAKGGNVRMGGSYMWPARYCELCGAVGVPLDGKGCDLGFRVALVQMGARDPDGKSCAMGTKGRVLLRSGCSGLARKYLSLALEQNGLTAEESKLLNDDWLKADRAYGYFAVTWTELMSTLKERLAGQGYQTDEVFRFWGADSRSDECRALRAAAKDMYRRHGVFGMNVAIADLPKEVTSLFASAVGRVQAVLCDFTGDGRGDLIVELAGCSDPSGVLYGFFERRKEGYVLLGKPVRTIGMCVIPKERGGVVALVLIKRTDTTLSAGVIDSTQLDKGTCLRIAWLLDRSFMLDGLDGAGMVSRLPFMGERSPERIRVIDEGAYARPLCWVWK